MTSMLLSRLYAFIYDVVHGFSSLIAHCNAQRRVYLTKTFQKCMDYEVRPLNPSGEICFIGVPNALYNRYSFWCLAPQKQMHSTTPHSLSSHPIVTEYGLIKRRSKTTIMTSNKFAKTIMNLNLPHQMERSAPSSSKKENPHRTGNRSRKERPPSERSKPAHRELCRSRLVKIPWFIEYGYASLPTSKTRKMSAQTYTWSSSLMVAPTNGRARHWKYYYENSRREQKKHRAQIDFSVGGTHRPFLIVSTREWRRFSCWGSIRENIRQKLPSMIGL